MLLGSMESPVKAHLDSWKSTARGDSSPSINTGQLKISSLTPSAPRDPHTLTEQLAHMQSALDATLRDLEDAARRESRLREERSRLAQENEQLRQRECEYKSRETVLQNSRQELANAGMAEAKLADKINMAKLEELSRKEKQCKELNRQKEMMQKELEAERAQAAQSLAAKKLVQFELGQKNAQLNSAEAQIDQLRAETDKVMLQAAGLHRIQSQLGDIRTQLLGSMDLMHEIDPSALDSSLVPVVGNVLRLLRERSEEIKNLRAEAHADGLRMELMQRDQDSLLGKRLAEVEKAADEAALRAASECKSLREKKQLAEQEASILAVRVTCVAHSSSS